jgi:hypothetical protein
VDVIIQACISRSETSIGNVLAFGCKQVGDPATILLCLSFFIVASPPSPQARENQFTSDMSKSFVKAQCNTIVEQYIKKLPFEILHKRIGFVS